MQGHIGDAGVHIDRVAAATVLTANRFARFPLSPIAPDSRSTCDESLTRRRQRRLLRRM